MEKDIMKMFIGKVIKVDRGGPESKIGMVLDASDDLIVLLTEDDGVVYYNIKHIKSFTDNIKDEMKFDIDVPKDFKFIKATNFHELLASLKFKWIKINRGGPEKLEGVLTEVDNDSVFLINNQEIVRLSVSHIRSISYGLIIKKAEEEKSDQQKTKDNSQNKKNHTNSKKKSSQKTTAKDGEMSLGYPLSTMVTSEETVVEVEAAESDLSMPGEFLQNTDVENFESDLEIPLIKSEFSQDTAVENAESDLEIPLNSSESSQKIAVEEAESDLTILFSVMEKFIRKYTNANLN
ncbi:DUF6897 domain-containing protein [Neobacillus drentensis]|uniref:DUF6897 domain-containing protein n=1 Tax=Neobacillus drentensis TaxID=220684 RepID=UPI002FFFD26D